MRAGRVIAAALALLLLGTASNQVITRGFIYSNIGTLFSWSGAAPSWSGSNQAATYNDFTTYVSNNGSCIPGGLSGLYLIDYGHATACAVNGTAHSQILANGSFAGASYASWTATGCSFQAVASPDQEGSDGGSAHGQSGVSSACSGGNSQTVSISGTTPRSQTYSFWYYGFQAQAGDPINCTQGFGSVSLSLVVNGTTVVTVASPTLDNAWHQVTGSMSALTTGSNTIALNASLTNASGTTGSPTCSTHAYTQQQINLDDIVIGATY